MLLFQKSTSTALTHKNSSLSFNQLREKVDQEKSKIEKQRTSSISLASTPRLRLLQADTSFDFLIKFLAAIESQQPVVLINSNWTESEKLSRLALLQLPSSASLVATPSHLHPECALILFTSGSSGLPKAVQLSLQNIMANTQAVITSLNFRQAPQQTLFLPLHYSFGILGQILPALQLGIETRLYASFNEAVAEIPRLGLAGMWSGVPSHWQTLLKFLEMQKNRQELTKSATHIVSAGAPLPLSLREQLMQNFANATIFNNYGLTECSPRVLSYNSKHPLFLQNYVGFPVGDFQVKISEQGELLLKGSQVMLGYLEESAKTTPGTAKIHEGWFYTGDLAEIHEAASNEGETLAIASQDKAHSHTSDKNPKNNLCPLIKILGRADDLIKIAGERFSKIEIEQVIKVQAGIEDAVVLTKEHPIYGQVLIAAIVLKENQTFDRSELITNLAKQISPQKIPKEFQLLSSLPRLTNGKLDRSRLLEMLNIK